MLDLLDISGPDLGAYVPTGSRGGWQATPNNNAPHEAARIAHRNREWRPGHYSGDLEVELSQDFLTSRVRDVIRNEPLLNKAVNTLAWLIVGTGCNTFAEARSNGEFMDDFCDAADRQHARWSLGECDYYGEDSLAEMQRQMFIDWVTVGNAFAIEVIPRRRGNRSVPLSYQLLEWEQIAREEMDTFFDPVREQRNRIQNGIEYDWRTNRKLALYAYDAHPYNDEFGQKKGITRIPWNRVIHLYRKTRISQTCGISWFAPIILLSRDFDRLLGNKLTISNYEALLSFVIKSTEDRASGLDEKDDESQPLSKFVMAHGNVQRLRPGEDIEVIQSDRNVAEFMPVADMLVERMSAGSGVSTPRLRSNASETNMATIKALYGDDAAMAEPIQTLFQNRVAKRMRTRYLEVAIANGVFDEFVTASQYRAAPAQWNECDAVCATRAADLTAKDDIEAVAHKIRAGIATWYDEVKTYGLYPRDVIRKVNWANRNTADASVKFDYSAGNGGMIAATSTDAAAVDTMAGAVTQEPNND